MPLSSISLEQSIEAEFKSLGINTTGEHCFTYIISKAVAKAVVNEIQKNAIVIIPKGDSAGSYKVT
ncbi:hypothetical protein [Vibrio metschnikovii]|uniref:hypothetical protein n=1 Tax=Vibrio metschnikovii TaxID=28172 RepID=UPI0030DCEAC8